MQKEEAAPSASSISRPMRRARLRSPLRRHASSRGPSARTQKAARAHTREEGGGATGCIYICSARGISRVLTRAPM
eukprot:5457057-Prymnesium_polylepis.1